MMHVIAMSKSKVSSKMYPVKMVVRAFEYMATSCALYNCLQEDYKLIHVKTLTRITSKVSKMKIFLWNVFLLVTEGLGNMKVLVCEDSRVNNNLFSSFSICQVSLGLLIFDYFHLVHIRNNWVTEKLEKYNTHLIEKLELQIGIIK